MAIVIQKRERVTMKDAANNFYDWMSSSPFFHWKWTILDVAVIALLIYV